MERNRVTICMATYNGIGYIEEQIGSILPQLSEKDEILISDDGSTDGTREYLLKLSESVPNLKILNGPQKGPSENFFFLISQAKNDIIFLSDQDDIWYANKVSEICDVFDKNSEILVVLHKEKVRYLNSGEEVDGIRLRHGLLKNVLRSSYSGHCMAIRSDFCKYIKPGYTKGYMAYDIYLGALAEKNHCSEFLDKILCLHLIHGSNVSKPLSVMERIKLRFNVLRHL